MKKRDVSQVDGQRKAPAPAANAVSVKSWDDWFRLCGTLQPQLKSYEDLMWSYYDTQFSMSPEGRQRMTAAYAQGHDSRFYANDSDVPGWKRNACIKKGVIAFVIAALLATAIFAFLLPRLSNLPEFLVKMAPPSGAALTDALIYSGIRGSMVGLVLGIVVFLLPYMGHKRRIKGLKKKMAAIEDQVKEAMHFFPPKYRNAFSMDVMHNLFRNYGVMTFSQATMTADDYMVQAQQNNQLVPAELFDVPYDPSAVDRAADLASGKDDMTQSGRGLYVPPEGTQQVQDPNLPEDIKDKTFAGLDDAKIRLGELVGLESVKQKISQMENRMEFYGGTGSSKDTMAGNHMCFLGPSGTGKTTVARIVTRILYDYGYIRENKCVEVDGSYFKSPYVGQTALRSTAIVKYAMGGVLFIDEAYLLMDDKSAAGAGTEAVGVLLKAMDDYKKDLVVILAGYEDSINRLLASNDGFSSRIKYKIYFDDFTTDEMMQIFYQLLDRCGSGSQYMITNDGAESLRKQFEKERGVPGFGNARVIITALDSILDVHADRFMKGFVDEKQKFLLTKDDVDAYVAVRSKQMVEDGRNFMASQNLDSSVVSLAELKGRTKDGSADPDKDLANLVGLETVKDEIKRMKAQYEFYDGTVETEGYHMCFVGPPGTGKTTVASIMTAYLFQMGIIRENKYLDINGDFLRGMYLGHTGKRTEAVIKYSQGMVLFVDEAYLLDSGNGQDNFGAEAVGVLLDAMEKYRKNFVVIFAGYEQEMGRFLDMNSGLASRISMTLRFHSYSPRELCKMLNHNAKSKGFKVDQEVWLPLQKYLKPLLTDPHFGNARFMRQFFEECRKIHIMNYSNGMYPETEKFVIKLADMEPLFARDVNSLSMVPESARQDDF